MQSFYLRRVFRILPAALVYLLFITALHGVGILAVSSQELLASLFFYRNYLDRIAPLTGHFWSLSIEEQFYLVWPSLLVLAGLKRARALAVFGIAGIVVWRQMHWPLPDFAYFHTDMRLDAILCGCVMALSWPYFKPICRRAQAVSLLAAIFCFFLLDLSTGLLKGGADFAQAVLACLLIGCTVAHPGRLFSRFLEWPPLKWVGRRSYSIYLWQQPFLMLSHGPHWQLPLRFAAILAVACLSYEFVERPLIAYGFRILSLRGVVSSPARIIKPEMSETAA